MKNTEYKDVFDVGDEVLSMENKFSYPAFPSFKNAFTIGENIRGMSNVSPLATYKFYNQNSNEIASKYFVDADPPEKGTFTYVSDIRSDLTPYIKDVKDFYYYEKQDVDHFAFKVILFSSTEATKLKECFEVCKPKGREVLMFIEDNKGDTSGTYGAIRISEELLQFFTNKDKQYKNYNFLSYDLQDNKNVYDYLRKSVPGITEEQLTILFHKGYIEDKRIGLVKDFFQLASAFSSGMSFIPGMSWLTNDAARTAMSAILGKAIQLIEKTRLEENRWQPKPPKKENGEQDENYRYESLISSGKDENGTINITQLAKILKGMLEAQNLVMRNVLLVRKDFTSNTKATDILEFLYAKYLDSYDIALGVINGLEDLSEMEFLKHGAQAYNALLCGVWNGLIDAVSGLFALVKMFYDGITLGKDFVQNIEKYLPTLLEQYDETIEAIKNISFSQTAKYIYTKLREINLTFDPVACAYFTGYVYGFIISLIIEVILTIILTVGTVTVPLIIEKLEEAIFGIFRLGWGIAKGTAILARTFAKFVVKSIKDVIKGFQELLIFLKQGWQEIKKIIDDVFSKTSKIIEEQAGIFIKKLPSNIGKFVDLLSKNFPKLQKKIVDGLLIIEFKGNILAKINPKGIITEIKYFRELNNYTYFTELKNVKIELEIVDDLGRKTIKKYEDTVEVMKKGDDVGFRAKFEEGKIRDGEYINYTYGKSGRDPAYATNPLSKSKTVDVTLQEGDLFYIVEYKDRSLQRHVPGGFGSKDKINTIKELRENIAVKKDWKDEARGQIVIRTYKVKTGKEIPARSGWVGPMLEDTPSSPYFNEVLPGGSHQYEFINAWDSDFVNLIDKIDEKILK